jgi:rare lipoprotein A
VTGRHPSSDRWIGLLLALALVGTLTGCASSRRTAPTHPGYSERGLASWYGPGFHGRFTANGEVYDMNELTAAHRTLPFDTIVEVRNRDNGRRTQVRITDRGPFVRGRIIDLSYAAAKDLQMIGPGVVPVEIRVVRGAPGGTPDNGFWVQVGAFRDAQEAQQFYRRMKKKFDNTQLMSDGTWHRVRLGPFARRRQADATQQSLRRQGFDAFVVRL